jgi:hypothetical protein
MTLAHHSVFHSAAGDCLLPCAALSGAADGGQRQQQPSRGQTCSTWLRRRREAATPANAAVGQTRESGNEQCPVCVDCRLSARVSCRTRDKAEKPHTGRPPQRQTAATCSPIIITAVAQSSGSRWEKRNHSPLRSAVQPPAALALSWQAARCCCGCAFNGIVSAGPRPRGLTPATPDSARGQANQRMPAAQSFFPTEERRNCSFRRCDPLALN